MRLVFVLGLGLTALYGQTCAPVVLLPSGKVSGSLDSTSCRLSDGTAYTPYRLNLAVRGQIQITLSPGSASLGLALQDSTGVQLASGLNIQRPLEAGTYTVVVNGQKPDQVGPFTLQTAFTPETGMLCTNFPSLGVSQTAAGTLGASGCTLPDGTAYEAYSLNTFGSGTLTVSATSATFTPVLLVRNTDGDLLASGQGSATVAVDAGSAYRVVVATADTTGAYQISTNFQADALDTCSVKKALATADTDQSSIDDNSCSMVTDTTGDLAYYNFYSLTLASAGLADVTVTSTAFQPTVYLLDSAGNRLAVDLLGGGANQSEIRMQLPPGDYTVQVVSSVSSGGAYSLAYGFTPGAPQPCQLTTATAGTAVTGTLSSSSCRTALGLADLYSVTLPSAGTLSVTLAATGFSGQVAIRDAKDNLIVSGADNQSLGSVHLDALLPAGSYTILAGAVSGSGAYQLTPAFTAKDIPACAQIQSLTLNGGYVRNLGDSGCTGANGQPADLYQFTLPADAVVAAVMTSNEVAGYLTLSDSNGNLLRSDRNSYANNDPLIVQFLPAGTYQLAARSAANGGGGLYQVSLLSAPGPRPPFCAPAGKLALGNTVSGTLTFTSCQYIDSTFTDLYTVVLAADTTIDLKLISTDFDAYLLVLDAKGNVVARDDDSAGGTDARIVRKLLAGTYFVAAKPFSDYYSVGAYTLSLQQSQ